MIVSNHAALIPETPTIDPAEARWAAAELSSLIARLGPDSPIGLVLRQARREVASLVQSTAPPVVVGPFRAAA
jgi:hypothetical protein